LTLTLGPQASLFAHGQEVLAAYHRLVQAGQQIRASVHRFYEQHPWAKEHTRLWMSEQRLFCAFAMLAVEAEGMGPKISPQEMEALALIVGIRLSGEEFAQAPKSNEQRQAARKSMMRDVNTSGVLPLLRQISSEFRLPEQAAGTTPTSPAQQVVPMPSPPTPPSVQPVTTSPEPPAAVPSEQPTTMSSSEQSEEEGGIRSRPGQADSSPSPSTCGTSTMSLVFTRFRCGTGFIPAVTAGGHHVQRRGRAA